MHSDSREEITAGLKALDAAVDTLLGDLDYETLTTRERLDILRHLETVRRRLPAIEHPLINELATHAVPIEIGGGLRRGLANHLHITPSEARRRINEAVELGPRRTLIGQPLEPLLPATAAAQRAGLLGREHVAVIRAHLRHLPGHIDAVTRASDEAELADYATQFRPDQLVLLAEGLADCHNPDGIFSDSDRAHRRGVVVGRQGPDGMSPISGWLDPQLRATLDAVFAKLAGPGMCNPADEHPCVSGTPSQGAIDADHRSCAQRHHDALTAMGRALLASGDLGQHNGLPVSIIASVTLDQLETATGKALTGGGTWLPMSDVIDMASHAHHYLRIYHGAKELNLFHTKRLANPGQRIVLYARDRGCAHPGCHIPAYFTEVHHNEDYAKTGRTDINDLTLRCPPDHHLITPGGYSTRTNAHGEIETLPPPHLDTGQPRVNTFHHPEKLLHRNRNDDGEGGDGDGEPGGDKP